MYCVDCEEHGKEMAEPGFEDARKHRCKDCWDSMSIWMKLVEPYCMPRWWYWTTISIPAVIILISYILL